MTAPTAHAPARVLGRYLLGPLVGRGATSRVFRAHDQATGGDVAVKEIPVELGLERRVGAEIRAASRLDHPAIVRLLDWGEERGCFYLVSELVEGDPLDRLLRERRVGGDRAMVALACDVLEALEHAHARGVVHRDVKPANVMVDAGGHARLTDFGVARLTGESSMTATGQVVGTMAYMPPEQAQGEPVDGGADVFAACLVLYEGLTGANPLMSDSPVETARRAAARAIPPLGRARPDLPDRLVRAVEAGLAGDPARRPAPGALARALREEGARVGTSARALLPPRVARWLPTVGSAAGAALLAGWAADRALGLDGLRSVGIAAAAAALAALRPSLAALAGVLASAALIARTAPALGVLALAAGLVAVALGRGTRRGLLLPAAAPPLFALGLGPLYVLLAGLMRGAWARAWAAATGGALVLAWQVAGGAGGLLFGDRPVRSALDALDGERDPLAAADRVAQPFRAHPEALVALGAMVAFAMLVPALLRVRGDGPRLLAALGWVGGLAAAQAVLVADPAAVIAAFLPSAILVAAWAARPWRVLARDPGRAAPVSGTAG